MFRIGHGYDVHRFSSGVASDAASDAGMENNEVKNIILGGASIPHTHSLIAHSDGDVLIHALCDALLGAIALGDIGQHFPDTDSAYKNIDSRELLKKVYSLVAEKNYQLGNADMTIVAQAPKMSGHIEAMRGNLAEDLKTNIENINVKATTTEDLGFTGRGEGIACYAVVGLSKN